MPSRSQRSERSKVRAPETASRMRVRASVVRRPRKWPHASANSVRELAARTNVRPFATRPRAELRIRRGAPRDATSDLDRLETGLAPVDDEHAEALLHAHLDVFRARRIAAG